MNNMKCLAQTSFTILSKASSSAEFIYKPGREETRLLLVDGDGLDKNDDENDDDGVLFAFNSLGILISVKCRYVNFVRRHKCK